MYHVGLIQHVFGGFPLWLSHQESPAVQNMQEMWVRSLGWEDPLKEKMATCSGILAWDPWTEELGRLQSLGSQTPR